MAREHFLLKDVAKRLGVKPYQVAYALSVGLVEEPELRISNKRIFQERDIKRLAVHFGVELRSKEGQTHDAP
jgi:DNA-binding transcriptional MerR regulator